MENKRREKAKSVLAKSGYGKMAHLVTEGVHEHEKNMRKGKKETKMKYASGGSVDGCAPKERMDRKSRAHGGRLKHGKGSHVKINIVAGGGKQPVPVPVPSPAMGAKMPMPSGAPMAPPPVPPGAGLPPSPLGQRPMGLKKGGRAVKSGGGPNPMKGSNVPHLEGGSGGGLGRLEKAAHEQKRKKGV